MQNTIGAIAAGLDKLTKQLNVFKPASSVDVEGAQKQFSEQIEVRLTLQSDRMELIAKSVAEQAKTANDNADLLKNLLIRLENMGENLKKMQEDMDYHRNPEV